MFSSCAFFGLCNETRNEYPEDRQGESRQTIRLTTDIKSVIRDKNTKEYNTKIYSFFLLLLTTKGEKGLNIADTFPYFLTYIHHKSHIFCWWRRTRGFLWAERNFLGIWSCKPATGRSFPEIVCLCLHSPPGTGSCSLVESLHIRTAWADHSTAHEHHLVKKTVLE